MTSGLGMLAASFANAKNGKKCRKCLRIVGFSCWKRHEENCTEDVMTQKSPVDEIDDDLCVVFESEQVVNSRATPSEGSECSVDVGDAKVVLKRSGSACETPPMKKPREEDKKPATVMSPRSQVYSKDPSEGLSIEEVYEKLMQQLETLIRADRNGGSIVASQTIERLSQSSQTRIKTEVEQLAFVELEDSEDVGTNDDTTSTTDENAAEEGPVNSGCSPDMDDIDVNYSPRLLKERERPPDKDVAETQIVQSDPRYGVSYVVRFFWKMLHRVLSRETGIHGERAEEFWGDALRTFYWLVTMSDSEQHLFVRLCIRHRKWLNLYDLQKYEKSGTEVIDIASNLVSAKLIEYSNSPDCPITLDEILAKYSKIDLLKLARTYRIENRLPTVKIVENIMLTSTGKTVFGHPLLPVMMSNAKKILGHCYRIHDYPLSLFNAVLTLYCPSSMDSINLFDPQANSSLASALMYQLLQVETGELMYCAPQQPTKCIQNYKDLPDLLNYIDAKKVEVSMAVAKKANKHEQTYKFGKQVYEQLKQLIAEKQDRFIELAKMPQHLRRFTDVWVVVRCCIHGVEGCERQGKYAEAVEIIETLLERPYIRPFFPDMRGFVYDRYAVDLQFHLKKSEKAIAACVEGLTDGDIRDKDKLLLQDRVVRSMPDFEKVVCLKDPIMTEVGGKILEKKLDMRLNRFYEQRGDDIEMISVEEVALRHYMRQDKYSGGLHAEGAVWHTIFGLICYDIIFDHLIDGVWLSPVQDHPLDMNTPGFYETRRERFEKRFSWVLDADDGEFYNQLKECYEKKHNLVNGQTSWSIFSSFEELFGLISCLTKEQLVMVMKRIAVDHRHNRSGFPDLTLWDPSTKRLAAIEVKGPSDKLSTKQRLWLDFFQTHGVNAFVCKVFAIKERTQVAGKIEDRRKKKK